MGWRSTTSGSWLGPNVCRCSSSGCQQPTVYRLPLHKLVQVGVPLVNMQAWLWCSSMWEDPRIHTGILVKIGPRVSVMSPSMILKSFCGFRPFLPSAAALTPHRQYFQAHKYFVIYGQLNMYGFTRFVHNTTIAEDMLLKNFRAVRRCLHIRFARAPLLGIKAWQLAISNEEGGRYCWA